VGSDQIVVMALFKSRKQSEFLQELDKYYGERQKYSNSFADVPCPQNFIPGATKAKENVKLVRTLSRRVGSVCYKGVVVRMKDKMTPVEKGVIPGGLVSLAFPAPSQHTSCLEHKMEQIMQRNSKLLSRTSTKSEHSTGDQEFQVGEDDMLLEHVKSRERSCSLPTTKRDIGALPIISYEDDCIFAEFGSVINRKRSRCSSYPLLNDDYESHARQPRSLRKVDNFDSASHLGAICRSMSYYGSPSKSSSSKQWKSKDGNTSSKKGKRTFGLASYRRRNDLKQNVLAETIEESESDAALQFETVEEETGEVAGNIIEEISEVADSVIEQGARERKYHSDPEEHIYSVKGRHSSSKLKGTRKRRSRKKVNDDSFILRNTNKETLAQIQNALRAKLPRTFQATVQVGLSFDPVTVKEKNDKVRQASTLPRASPGKSRSRSLIGITNLVNNGKGNKVAGKMTDVPSVVVSPPTREVNDELPPTNEEAGAFINFLRMGKDTLSRTLDRWSYKNRRDRLRSSSATDIACFQSLPERHAKKLKNLLGDEFKELYLKQRSNSLPLIKNRRITQISTQHRLSFNVKNEVTWSSPDTSDSDLSHIGTSQETSMESEASDYDEQFVMSKRGTAHSEEEKVTLPSSVAIVISSGSNEQDRRPDRDSLDIARDLEVQGHKDSEQLPGKSLASEERQFSNTIVVLNSQGTVKDNEASSPFRVQTSYVMNKSKLLKTSKELMEESKGQNLEHIDIAKKSRKKRYKKVQSERKTKEESMHSNEGSFVLDKPSIRANEKNVSKGKAESDASDALNSEVGNVSANKGNIDIVCESELGELDMLLAELEMYSMN